MNKIIGKLAILVLAFSGVLSIGAMAQSTDEGPGPSEQPNAPMEVGQPQASDSPDANPSDMGDQNAQPTEAEPGGPTGEGPAQVDQGVARISLIHGNVSTQRGDSGDWSAATLNQPVMGGDKVSTGDDSRAELQLDFANTIRLGPNSKANIATFTHKNIQIQLGEGIASYTVSRDSEVEPEIDTPNVSIHPAHQDGVFRIEVHPDGDTLVIVRQGEAQIATPQGSTELHTGDMATIRGDVNEAQYKIAVAPDRDSWDQWNSDRDHLIQNANSWRHTNRRYTGAQDLDAYGRWEHADDYGDVWVPNEPADWVPYRDGNWVWEPSYGWTWVGYEPWGWAPYHYGRWFWYNSAWAWWPGPIYAGYNPFWAPAYVSFWGWGGGFGFGFGWGGWGGFGWLPLGPCDWFHPWWGGYGGRFGWVGRGGWGGGWGGRGGWGRYGGIAPLHNGLRYSNVANIRDAHIGRAMSAVNAGHFGAGRVGAMAATRQQLGGARMMAGNLPVVPTRASLSASGRPAAAGTMRNSGAQHFFGSQRSNMARPASFQQQRAGLQQSMQRSHVGAIPAGGRSSFAANSNMRPSAGTPASRQMNNFGNRAGMNNSGAQNRGGFSSMAGANRNGNSPAQTSRGFGGQSSGYRPFTPPNSANRSNGSIGTRSYGGGIGSTPQRSTTQGQGGFRPFTPPSNGGRSYGSSGMNSPAQRGTYTPPSNSGMSRGSASPSYAPRSNSGNGGYWNRTAPSNSGMSRGSASPSYAPRSNSGNGSYWNRTAPSSPAPRSYGSYGGGSYGGGAYSRGGAYGGGRPQLDMRQPIVRSPSYGGYGGSRAPSYGGSRSMPSYGGSRGPSSFGGGRAPSGGGGHFGGGGGGHSGGGGGGHSGGGGGGHSGGGGGHGGHR